MIRNLGFQWIRAAICVAAMLFVGLALTVTPVLASEKRFVSVSDLIVDLRTEDIDRIVETMNNIKSIYYKEQILPFVEDLWLQKRDAHPDLPWELIASDRIRIELADILMQARRNDLVDLDKEPFRQYARGLIQSRDVAVVWGAITVLGAIDDERDVGILVEMAQRRSNMGIFRSTVLSLAWMCNKAAAQGLANLEAGLVDREQKTFLREIQQKFAAMRSEADWCTKWPAN